MPEENGPRPAGSSGAAQRGPLLLLAAAVLGLGLGTAAQLVDVAGPHRWVGTVLLGLGASAAVPGVVAASPWWQHRGAERLRQAAERHRRDVEWRVDFGGTARGVAEAHWPGEFFTGRTAALRALADWLADENGDPVRLVVGQPGSGKSAVLGRVVRLANPALAGSAAGAPSATATSTGVAAEPAVAPGSVDLALSARGRTLAEVVSRIATAAGIQTDAVDELLLGLQGRRRPLVVVLDALNESTEPGLLARELVSRVAETGPQAGVRLLVGARRNMVPVVRAADRQVLDLDTPAFFAPADLVEYVRKLLRSTASPSPSAGRSEPRRVDEVARGVARRAGTAFLIAQLTARAVARDPGSWDTTSPGWEQQFPDSVGAAMDAYLARLADGDRVRALLLPLAFAGGDGLAPDRLWAELATALGTRVVTEQDVRWLVHESGAAALVRKTGIGAGARFGLFHEALAEHLRTSCPHEQPDAAVAAVLLGGIRPDGSGWREIHPYAREHVATHLARSGQLDEWLLDGNFLRTVAPGPLLRALPGVGSAPARQAAGVYREVLLLLRENPQWSSSYLELYARQQGHSALADGWTRGEGRRPWAVGWARCRATAPHQVVGRHAAEITALSAVPYPGGLLVVAGDAEGAVGGWDLATSAPMIDTIQVSAGTINALVVVPRPDGVLLVAGTDRGLYRARYDDGWNVLDVERLDEAAVTSLALLPGAGGAVAAGDRAGVLRVWSARSAALLHGEAAHPQGVSALARCDVDTATVLLSAGFDGSVSAWDVSAGVLQRRLTWRGIGGVRALGLRPAEAVPQVVAATEDGVIRSWPLTAGRQQVTVLSADEHVGGAVALAQAWGRPVVLTGGFVGEIAMWDSTDSARLWGPVAGHLGVVSALAAGRLAEADRVVSGGEDGYVRSWDLDAAATPDAATGHTGEVTDAVILRLGDRAAVVSSSADGAIQALDPDTGAALDLAWAPPDGGIRCLATTPFPAGPALLAGGLDGTLTAWDRAGQVLTAAAVRAHRRVLRAIGTATVSGRDVVITGGDDGVRTWDPTGWQPTGTAVDCDVRTLCTVDTGSRIVLACGGDDGLRFWDLTAGRPIAGPALRWQQCRSVAGVRVGDRPMVVSGGEAGVQFWDPADGSPSGDPFAADQEVFTVAVVQLAGSPVLLWGDHEGLGIWSIRQHREIVRIKLGFPIRRVVACGSDAVIAVASHGVLRIDLDLAAHPSTGSGPTPRPAVALRRQR